MSEHDPLRHFVQAVHGHPLPLGPIGRTLVPGWTEWLRGGSPEADWWICLSGFMGPVERYRALRRILGRMGGPPIHPARWSGNRDKLLRALDDMGVKIDQLAEMRGWEAVEGVLSAAVDYTAPHDTVPEGTMRKFMTTLERLICEDLLGPGWRRHEQREEPLPEDQDWVTEEAAAAELAWASVEALLSHLDLTPTERALWDAYREAEDWSAARKELGLTPAAFRQRKSRLLSKLAPVKEALQDA